MIPRPLAQSTLAGLVACGVATPTSPEGADAAIAADVTAPEDDLRADVRGAATEIARVADRIDALDVDRLAEARGALRELARNDPYVRVALLLPEALHATVAAVSVERVDRFVQRDWAYLQQGLATHVAVLDALDVDLAPPGPGDVLFGQDEAWTIDRDAMRRADDPVAAAGRVVRALGEADVPDGAWVRLDTWSAVVEDATGVARPCPRDPWGKHAGQPWTLGLTLGGWHDALRRVAPFVSDPEVASQVQDLLALFDAYEAAGRR